MLSSVGVINSIRRLGWNKYSKTAKSQLHSLLSQSAFVYYELKTTEAKALKQGAAMRSEWDLYCSSWIVCKIWHWARTEILRDCWQRVVQDSECNSHIFVKINYLLLAAKMTTINWNPNSSKHYSWNVNMVLFIVPVNSLLTFKQC